MTTDKAMVTELEEAIRLAEIGEYLYNRSYSYGDGHTEPREYGIEWQWQQSKPDEFGQGVLLAEAVKWHSDMADDGILTEAAKLRAALSAALTLERGEAEPAAVTREAIDTWLTANCGVGIPYNEATDLGSMLHGIAYILRQIEGTKTYKVNIGQVGPATSALRMALDHFATEALSTLSKRGEAEETPAPVHHVPLLTCQCENSKTDPCIVCGKGKTLVTAEWMQKMAAREGDHDATTGSPAPVSKLMGRLASALEVILPWAEDKWANPDAISEIVNAREVLKEALAALATTEGSDNG